MDQYHEYTGTVLLVVLRCAILMAIVASGPNSQRSRGFIEATPRPVRQPPMWPLHALPWGGRWMVPFLAGVLGWAAESCCHDPMPHRMCRSRSAVRTFCPRSGTGRGLPLPGGVGGAEWHSGLLRLSSQPPHIRNVSLEKKMKFIKGARNWRSIFGTPNFFLASDPPPAPERSRLPLSRGLEWRSRFGMSAAHAPLPGMY